MSIIIGWVVLTVVAIGVSSAAVGNVGERVSPQPASVLQAAGDVVSFASDSESDEPSEPTTPPTSTIIDPADAATAVPSTTGASPTTTGTLPPTPSTRPPRPTTTSTPSDSTTTTLVDSSTTTTSTSTAPTTTSTTTVPVDVKQRTIESKGGWIWIRWTPTELTLLRRSGQPGFGPGVVVEADDEHLVVRFASKKWISRISVRLVDDGRIRVDITEKPKDG